MTAEAEARRALHADPQCAHRWTALMACDFCDAHDPAGLDAPDAARLDVERQRLIAAAIRYYADTMPGYAAAAGLSQDEYAAVMVDVKRARALAAEDRP